MLEAMDHHDDDEVERVVSRHELEVVDLTRRGGEMRLVGGQACVAPCGCLPPWCAMPPVRGRHLARALAHLLIVCMCVCVTVTVGQFRQFVKKLKNLFIDEGLDLTALTTTEVAKKMAELEFFPNRERSYM